MPYPKLSRLSNADIVVRAGSGGSQLVDLWAHGRRYNGGSGNYSTGDVTRKAPRPTSLLDKNRLFVRSRPQYENLPVSSFRVATDYGIANDGTGDNTDKVNGFLRDAASAGQVAYFPSGIYSIQGTVNVPLGSRIQGASWSQLQANGKYFQDINNPQVFVRVGKEGDSGKVEITDMLFSAKGPVAGAIMMEWNVHEASQGSGKCEINFSTIPCSSSHASRHVGLSFQSGRSDRVRP